MDKNVRRFFDRRIRDVEDKVNYIGVSIGERLSALSAIIGVGILVLFSIFVLGLTIPIDTRNTGTIIRSLFILWGYLFLFDSVFLLSYLLLSNKYTLMTMHTDRYEKIILIIALLVSTQIKTGRLIEILGLIGFGLMVILYIYFGKWPFIPGNAVDFLYDHFGSPPSYPRDEWLDDSTGPPTGGTTINP